MNVYATYSDLQTWLGTTPPTNADELLRTATTLVATATGRNPYVDTPTGPDVAPLRDATTAQVAAWIATGVTPSAGGLDTAPVKGKKLGSADITYDTTGQTAARTAAATMLTAEARDILYNARLLTLDLPQWTDPDTDSLADYTGAGTVVGRPMPREWWQNL